MAAASNRFWWVPFGSVPEISAGDLHACITEGRAPCLLDVRTNREWVASRISGAVNLPITDFRSGLDALELDRGGAIEAFQRSERCGLPGSGMCANCRAG
jgi:rhodanese-related sulfurtransferase